MVRKEKKARQKFATMFGTVEAELISAEKLKHKDRVLLFYGTAKANLAYASVNKAAKTIHTGTMRLKPETPVWRVIRFLHE